MSEQWRLLADIGGTNIRFGLARGSQALGSGCEITNLQSWPADRFSDFNGALRTYLGGLNISDLCLTSAAVAAAGPGTTDLISLTNRDWTITRDELRHELGGNIKTRLLNDLEAVAYALPFLTPDSIDWWDDRRPPSVLAGRRLALNVGTGFGSAVVIAADDGWVCCPAESGHMHLSVSDAEERTILAAFGGDDVTVEDVLSGDGAFRLWQAIAEAQSPTTGAWPGDTAFDLTVAAPAMAETRAMFGEVLARTAADLVLASASWDGVFLCGSVVSAWAVQADRAAFRHAFSGTSKMRGRLANTPIGLIHHPFPALVGLAHIAMP